MEIFCFNPSTNRETLKEFNERVQEFCLEEGAVAITPSVFGKTLVLAITTVGDSPDAVGGMDTIMPAVLAVDSKDTDVEEQLGRLMQREREKATDEEPVREPTDLRVLQNGHDTMKGWAICVMVTGEIRLDSEDEDEGGGEDEGGDEGEVHEAEVLPPGAQP